VLHGSKGVGRMLPISTQGQIVVDQLDDPPVIVQQRVALPPCPRPHDQPYAHPLPPPGPRLEEELSHGHGHIRGVIHRSCPSSAVTWLTSLTPLNSVQVKRRRYGRFVGEPDEGQLAGSFHLDATARRRAMACNGARNQVGWAVQLGTVRFLGTFLEDPEEVPGVVAEYVADQLGLTSAAFAGYGRREARWDHQEQIRAAYGYTPFGFEQWFALACWLYRRAWIASERPTLLFDLATARLVNKKVLLPGVTTLERLVAGVRERAEQRLWATLAAAPTPEQADRLQQLVVVPPGRRVSELDRLRRSPRDITARGVGKALTRYRDLASFGGGQWDLTRIPPGRLHSLVRFARAARAQAVADLSKPRRLATLVAFAAVMPQIAAVTASGRAGVGGGLLVGVHVPDGCLSDGEKGSAPTVGVASGLPAGEGVG
jgi:hypothetical protein